MIPGVCLAIFARRNLKVEDVRVTVSNVTALENFLRPGWHIEHDLCSGEAVADFVRGFAQRVVIARFDWQRGAVGFEPCHSISELVIVEGGPADMPVRFVVDEIKKFDLSELVVRGRVKAGA